jgi:hypothetical protein
MAMRYKGVFYVYFTLSEIERDGKIFMYIALSKSKDLNHWSPIQKLTPRDQNLDYSSPGNIIRFKNKWVLCCQTYPRLHYTTNQMPRYGNADARLFTMESKDLEHWTYQDHVPAGENVCILLENDAYMMFHSPKNGIGIKKSTDLTTWEDIETALVLGQKDWLWAKGRITAGYVLNLKKDRKIKRYLMFFHGSGPKTEEGGDFDKNASIGLAWSTDLLNWEWAK